MTNVNDTTLQALRHAYQRLNDIPHNYKETDFKLLREAIRQAEDDRKRLIAAWCGCSTFPVDPVYMPDDTCACGEGKHHYHCPACRGICQVG